MVGDDRFAPYAFDWSISALTLLRATCGPVSSDSVRMMLRYCGPIRRRPAGSAWSGRAWRRRRAGCRPGSMTAGSNVSWTTSACPVRLAQTCVVGRDWRHVSAGIAGCGGLWTPFRGPGTRVRGTRSSRHPGSRVQHWIPFHHPFSLHLPIWVCGQPRRVGIKPAGPPLRWTAFDAGPGWMRDTARISVSHPKGLGMKAWVPVGWGRPLTRRTGREGQCSLGHAGSSSSPSMRGMLMSVMTQVDRAAC